MGVKRVIDLARSLDEGLVSGDREKLLSSNLVAGVSVNLPIYKICRPIEGRVFSSNHAPSLFDE